MVSCPEKRNRPHNFRRTGISPETPYRPPRHKTDRKPDRQAHRKSFRPLLLRQGKSKVPCNQRLLPGTENRRILFRLPHRRPPRFLCRKSLPRNQKRQKNPALESITKKQIAVISSYNNLEQLH